jgi:hypothetical protein
LSNGYFSPEGSSYNYTTMYKWYLRLLLQKRKETGTQRFFSWFNSKLFSPSKHPSETRDKADTNDNVVACNCNIEDLFGFAFDKDASTPSTAMDEDVSAPPVAMAVVALHILESSMAYLQMLSSSIPEGSSPTMIVLAFSEALPKQKSKTSCLHKKTVAAVSADNVTQPGTSTCQTC